MEEFLHRQNLAHFRDLLVWVTSEEQRRQIEYLIAEEEAKEPFSDRERQTWADDK